MVTFLQDYSLVEALVDSSGLSRLIVTSSNIPLKLWGRSTRGCAYANIQYPTRNIQYPREGRFFRIFRLPTVVVFAKEGVFRMLKIEVVGKPDARLRWNKRRNTEHPTSNIERPTSK